MSSICAAQPRILIADDQPDLIDALRLLLKGEGIHVDAGGVARGGPRRDRRAARSTCC